MELSSFGNPDGKLTSKHGYEIANLIDEMGLSSSFDLNARISCLAVKSLDF